MEEIGQILVELFLQLFFEVVADFVWRHLPEPARIGIKVLLSGGFAVLLAWLSTLVVSKAFISIEALRVVYLVVAPVLLGLAMAWVGRYFVRKEKPRSTLEGFGFGWFFAFSFALTRYLLTR